MPTKPKLERGRMLEFVPAEDEFAEGEYEDIYSDEEQAYRTFQNEMGADDAMAVLRVSRIPDHAAAGIHPTNAKSILCFSCPIDQYRFDELVEYIRRTYGGGLYRLIGVKTGKQGNLFNRLINIAKPIETNTKNDSETGQLGNLIDSVSRMMMEMQTRTEQMIRQMAPQVTMQNPLEMMKAMAEMMAVMNSMQSNNNKGTDIITELERISRVNELIGHGGGNSGEANFYSLMSDVVKNIGPGIMAAAAQMQAQQVPPSLPNPNAKPAPQQSPRNVSQAKPKQEPKPVNQMQALKAQVDVLLENARSGADPEELAEMVLDHTPDDAIGKLYDFLSNTQYFDLMSMANSEVKKYPDFFKSLRNKIIELIDVDSDDSLQAPDDDPIVDPSNAGGSATGDSIGTDDGDPSSDP